MKYQRMTDQTFKQVTKNSSILYRKPLAPILLIYIYFCSIVVGVLILRDLPGYKNVTKWLQKQI